MTPIERVSALLLPLLMVACGSEVTPPDRPATVSREAVWSGGVDGGCWVDCRFAFKEPFTAFDCEIWTDAGQPWAVGQFVVWKADDGSWKPSGGVPFDEVRDFSFYNGVTIVVSDKKELRPDGWIDYPFGDGHGKRERYVDGQEVEVVSY